MYLLKKKGEVGWVVDGRSPVHNTPAPDLLKRYVTITFLPAWDRLLQRDSVLYRGLMSHNQIRGSDQIKVKVKARSKSRLDNTKDDCIITHYAPTADHSGPLHFWTKNHTGTNHTRLFPALLQFTVITRWSSSCRSVPGTLCGPAYSNQRVSHLETNCSGARNILIAAWGDGL